MNHGVIISLAVIDFILGILLYVTIRQIQTLTTAMDAIDKMACDAKAKAERNSRRIEDCYKGIQLCSRDTSEAYTLAAECRNELTRQHMIMRKETEK
ncbi:hypothetical protein [Galactobacillus timonensis]|uniref:hypothetical protein n=1 Tax=Galactobacillus timonensis TaxID=2041840 RepID=UPI000C8462D0|nr:hypothetical protein [Galactobacillus timonensis]